MIVTKEQQEALLAKYAKDHTSTECIAFIEGLSAAFELVGKILDEPKK